MHINAAAIDSSTAGERSGDESGGNESGCGGGQAQIGMAGKYWGVFGKDEKRGDADGEHIGQVCFIFANRAFGGRKGGERKGGGFIGGRDDTRSIMTLSSAPLQLDIDGEKAG